MSTALRRSPLVPATPYPAEFAQRYRDAGYWTDETFARTNLGHLAQGDPVNLERAMTAATRFGGHVVQGHVDGVGTVISREPSENWEWVRVQIPAELMKYVVLKGSITIDGVSLTVNEVGEDFVGLSLIPETLRLTTLGSKQPGDLVNLEADVVARHVARLREFAAGTAGVTEVSLKDWGYGGAAQ